MGLTAQINALKQQLGSEIPREILVEIGQFVKGLAQSGIEQAACRAGDVIPAFSLPDVSGRQVSSGEILARGPVVISFYRGVW